jgi:phosphate transport system permease protein
MSSTDFREAGSRSASRAPSGGEILADRLFRGGAYVAGALVILLLGYILWEIGSRAAPAMQQFGLGFLTEAVWDPGEGRFGVLAEIWGTLYSSVLAVAIAAFFGVGVAIFLTQDFLDARLARVFRTVIEMLAAIPSVVFGLWGIYVVIPALRPVASFLSETFGWFPLFSTSFSGPSMAPAVIVLAIMVLPTVAAISQDAFSLIPYKTKEAAFGMGTTRWEAITRVMLPTASSGIFASLVLGFGRALGETMALAMLIGNSNQISWSLFAPANTLASLLASQFPEASGIETQALMYAAIVLLVISLAVNVVGTLIMAMSSKQKVG